MDRPPEVMARKESHMSPILILRWQYRIRRLQGRGVITAAVLAVIDTLTPAPF